MKANERKTKRIKWKEKNIVLFKKYAMRKSIDSTESNRAKIERKISVSLVNFALNEIFSQRNRPLCRTKQRCWLVVHYAITLHLHYRHRYGLRWEVG